jgi:3-(methylsulfanyl)propanoyl-CoA dehydrogenase
MGEYEAPLESIKDTLRLVGIDELCELPAFAHCDGDAVDTVLSEFARFAGEVVVPTNRTGDRQGAMLDPNTGNVATADGFQDAYARYVSMQWGGITFPPEFGGGGLPTVLGVAVHEILASANLAFSLTSVLTHGAINLLLRCATERQCRLFLPRLVTGEWTATMNLTEPQAGSDVGAVRTRARRRPDDRWEITGTKIFITWGEHDLTDNIVHLVLARTPDAPLGTAGLSLFLVPKFSVSEDGTIGPRNSVRCQSIEDKLGIHGSPTCALEFDHAVGELVGEENRGMAAMFTMMNAARLLIGLEGVAVSELAFQRARDFARERVQGHASDGGRTPGDVTIMKHPDVRRMLMEMASTIAAMRLLVYSTAAAADRATHTIDTTLRSHFLRRVDLLTPIAKAWCSDQGVALTSLAIQVFGGSGYIEDTGVAQYWRDSRIAPIYEGTNGIQAIDFAVRKVGRDGGAAMYEFIEELERAVAPMSQHPEVHDASSGVESGLATLRTATDWVVETLARAPDDVLAGASRFLDLAGAVVGGCLISEKALMAIEIRSQPCADEAVGQANFFAVEHLGGAAGMLRSLTSGSERLRTIDPDEVVIS